MYLPEIFKNNNSADAFQFIENNNFGDLITHQNNTMCSNKVPFLLDKKTNCLYGHFSKSNPQLIDIEKSSEALVVFSGADSYISPLWYASRNMVPTWNFQTLQIRGSLTLVNDDQLVKILEKLTEFHESDNTTPWTLNNLDEDRLKQMLNFIVGFKVQIDDIKFKEKMSQNRGQVDAQSIIDALAKRNTVKSNDVAQIMVAKQNE